MPSLVEIQDGVSFLLFHMELPYRISANNDSLKKETCMF